MVPAELRALDSMNHMASTSFMGCYGQEPAALADAMRASALKKGLPAKVHAWKSGTDGWVCDFTLERIPWSFTVESIALGPKLTVWAGSDDIPAISVGATFLTQLVPGAQLRIVEGGDHGFKSCALGGYPRYAEGRLRICIIACILPVASRSSQTPSEEVI